MQILRQMLGDYTFLVVTLCLGILGATCGMVSSFSVLKKESLLADSIGHASLPGVVLAYILTNSKKMEVLLFGAFLFGIISTLLILWIVNNSKIKHDGAMALALSSFFGLGMVLLTYVQKTPNANQAGLNRFIFGQASTLILDDAKNLMIISITIFFIILLFWKELKLVIFDRDFAMSLGFRPAVIDILFSALQVLAIVTGLEAVGAVLIASLIITPGAAARQWTDKLSVMVMLSCAFGALSGIIGTVISFLVPKIPTGPVVVIVLSIFALISVLFSPKRGVVLSKLKRGKAGGV
ncbi:MAG: metal ABC transporter permease [Clostridiaceae bacterium]|nr:metal ABC transporter permease [Clostridiaceae bacterium]